MKPPEFLRPAVKRSPENLKFLSAEGARLSFSRISQAKGRMVILKYSFTFVISGATEKSVAFSNAKKAKNQIIFWEEERWKVY